VQENIARLKDIGTYRGRRHAMGLPVRGQRTRTQVGFVVGIGYDGMLTVADYNGAATEQDGERRLGTGTGLRQSGAYQCTILYTFNMHITAFTRRYLDHNTDVCVTPPSFSSLDTFGFNSPARGPRQ
jgi:hypothetical protein